MSLRNRIIFNIILGLSILFMPWWLSVGLGILMIAFIRNPYEILVWGLFMDSLYGFSGTDFFFIGTFTWAAVIALLISIFLKERLLFYNE